MLEIAKTWTSTGSSGGLDAVRIIGTPVESVIYVQFSTLATTQSWSFQSAQDSTGPWMIEASGTISTAASTQVSIRLSGPFGWVRPYLHTVSTGTYQFRLIGVS